MDKMAVTRSDGTDADTPAAPQAESESPVRSAAEIAEGGRREPATASRSLALHGSEQALTAKEDAAATDSPLEPTLQRAHTRAKVPGKAKPKPEPERPGADSNVVARETTDRVAKPDLPAAFQQTSIFEDLSETSTSKRRRKFLLALSAIIGVLLPGLLAIAYYGFIATDQFITEVRFLVKSGGPVTPDLLGQLTGTGSSISTFLDAQTVSDYLHSRQVIEDIQPDVDLREMFARRWADPIARLAADASIEDLTDYWQSRVEVSTEMMSGIVTVNVRTFTPDDSARLGQAILSASERLVNQLSARAREDTVRFATEDLQSAEERLRFWRARVYQLREKEQTLDAAGTAEAHTQLVGELDAELAKLRSELQYRQAIMGSTAPLVMSLRSKIDSVRNEIERVRRQATSGGRGLAAAPGSAPSGTSSGSGREALTSVLSGFEEAQAELGIAEEYYKSALRYLEESRAEADRQQSYVATIVGPHMAQDSRYPLRIQFIIFAVVVAGLVWGLTMLMVFSIRDHLM